MGNDSIGGYAEARSPGAVVDILASNSGYRTRWPWPVRAAFGYGFDDVETTVTYFPDTARDKTNSAHRVISSNEIDFFQDFASQYGSAIGTFGGAFGNEWDNLTASMGEVSAGMRREVERTRTGEALAAVAAPLSSALLAGREAARDDAFISMGLFYEHDWTTDSSIGQSNRPGFERDRLARVQAYTQSLAQDSLAALAGLVAYPRGERYVVFNPLSWSRTDFVDLPASPSGAFHVIEVATGLEVPSQTLAGGGVRILAGNVPSIGYTVYEVIAGAGQGWSAAATIRGSTMDNGVYAVTLSTDGSITSVVDHLATERQLVPSGSALSGKGNPGAVSGAGAVVTEASGAVFATLKVVAPGAPSHEARVTLYRGLDRVEIANHITQNFSATVGYDFNFNLSNFSIHHEEVGMIAKVARMSAGGSYADQNSRTDYLTLNHFVDLSESGFGVTLSSWDSSFMRVGNSTTTSLDATLPRVFALVGGRIDADLGLGIPSQGGDTSFLNRFAFRGHSAYNQPAAMRFALEHQNPLVAARLTGNAGGSLPADQYSALAVSDPDILVWAFKPAEEGIGAGRIVRVWNLADAPRTLDLSLAQGIGSAQKCTHIETDVSSATVSGGHLIDTLARQQLSTYRLVSSSTGPVAVPFPRVAAGLLGGLLALIGTLLSGRRQQRVSPVVPGSPSLKFSNEIRETQVSEGRE